MPVLDDVQFQANRLIQSDFFKAVARFMPDEIMRKKLIWDYEESKKNNEEEMQLENEEHFYIRDAFLICCLYANSRFEQGYKCDEKCL